MNGSQIRTTDENIVRNGSMVPIINDIGPENQLFKTFPDNMKLSFNSPIQSKSQFPTPYSSNLLDTTQRQNIITMNNNNNNHTSNSSSGGGDSNRTSHSTNITHSNSINTTYTTHNYDTTFYGNPDSSFIDKNSSIYSNNEDNTRGIDLNNTIHTVENNKHTDIKKKKNIHKNNRNKTNNDNENENEIIEDVSNINTQSSNALQFSFTESTIIKQSKHPSKININYNNNNSVNRLNVPNNIININNNDNIHTDFLLPSPVPLGDFLYDSPAGISFFQNTPAKSPLKFITEEFITSHNNNNNKITSKHGKQHNGPTSSKSLHLFNSTNNRESSNNMVTNGIDTDISLNQNNNTNTNNTLIDIWDRLSNNTRTPLRKIDINLMFNNGQLLTNSNSLSPLKKFSMSLTPYGRKILNDLGTPFNYTANSNQNQNINNNNIVTSSNIKTYLFGGSSNSAMIDFQRARKDTIFDTPNNANSLTKNNVILSPSKLNSFDIAFRSPKLITTPKKDKGSNKNCLTDSQAPKLKTTNKKEIHDSIQLDSIDKKLDTDVDVDESSPTTIQLNSSVTKSLPKMDRNSSNKLVDRIPLLSRNMSPLQKVALDMSFSPTPRSNLHAPVNIKPHFSAENRSSSNILTFLPVSDLPKMGSFKSERTTSTLTNNDTLIDSQNSQTSASLSKLPSITTFPSTTILPPQIHAKKGVVKKKKVTKVKQPKFQIFVSSVHKFNDPNSSVPVTSLKHGHHAYLSTNNKTNKRNKK